MLNFKIIQSFYKLGITSASLKSNGLIFSEDVAVNIQLVTFLLLLFNTIELSIVEETKKNW